MRLPAMLRLGTQVVTLTNLGSSIADCRKRRVPCVRSSGDFLPPSPPSEEATARQDQAGQSCTGDRAGDGRSGSGHLNEVNEARASLGRSWDAVVTVGQALLDHYYPAHTFDGSSGMREKIFDTGDSRTNQESLYSRGLRNKDAACSLAISAPGHFPCG
jgi:hypothetical protein